MTLWRQSKVWNLGRPEETRYRVHISPISNQYVSLIHLFDYSSHYCFEASMGITLIAKSVSMYLFLHSFCACFRFHLDF